jgi:hypothetical protein
MPDEPELWGANIVPPDMQQVLLLFNEDAKRILDSSLGYLASQEPPPVIYHYTDDKGLRGILESGCFWLTDVFSLNDPSEMAHGFKQAIKVLNARAAAGPPESQTFARVFEAFAPEGAIQKIAHFFVCSFSAHGDDLGQWRAYADNGRGYALAFEARTLEKEFVAQTVMPPFSNGTFPVLYDDARLSGIYGQIVDSMFQLISLPRGRSLASANEIPPGIGMAALASAVAYSAYPPLDTMAVTLSPTFRPLTCEPTSTTSPAASNPTT